MSVDDTIRELSGTIAQLGLLVGKINEQIGGLSSRVNITLQTFDDSVSGIARDANKMTEQVDQTIAQIPGSWTFYVLFFSLLVVLLLLSVLILINLVAKIQSICRRLGAESSRSSTPLILHHSESKQPILHNPAAFGYSRPAMPVVEAPTAAAESSRLRHIAVEMESEPRRFGIGSAQPRTYQQQQRMQMRQQATAADILSNGNNGSEQQRSRGTAPAANSPRSQRGAASESVLPTADQIPPPESSQPKTKPEPLARTLRL